MDWQKEFPKKTLFWKHMIVALQAMYQEYELYECLAKDRQRADPIPRWTRSSI